MSSTNGQEDVMSFHPCGVCHRTKDQHLLIQCDTCINYYHLACLDPPLTRMPKKTKQMGWQCSDCCKSSDSDKASEIDTAAPRRLRRIVKEPSKFSPTKEQKGMQDTSLDPKSGNLEGVTPEAASRKNPKAKSPRGRGKGGVKRRSSAEMRRGKKKVYRRSLDVDKKGSSAAVVLCAALPLSGNCLDMSADSLPSASSLNSPHSESWGDDDPTLSPRKEKRHRDGSKKKKKDKDKDKELDGGGGRKKKKHKDKQHNLGEMASEFVSAFRLKIKSVPPPRPADSDHVTFAPLTAPHTTSTTTAPPGYPPLPPGYTLTQPMMDVSSIVTSSTTADVLPSKTSSANTTNCASVSTTTVSTSSIRSAPKSSSGGRRKSECGAEQFSKCDVCGETGGVTNTVTCDECLKAYHFNCLEPPLKKSPKRRGYSWFCEDCDNTPNSAAEFKLT